MRDIRIISARAILPVRQVVPVRGFSPTSVLVMGDAFDKTSEVFYNDVKVEQFLIQSTNRLLVRVPVSQLGRPLTSVVAYAEVATHFTDAALSFKVPTPVRALSGVERMTQAFLLVIMTTPGSDIFSKNSGGGIKALIGKTANTKGSSISSDIAMAVERTKAEILREQAKHPGIPLDERLMTASLDTVSFDKESSTIYAKISLQNMLGQGAEVNLG